MAKTPNRSDVQALRYSARAYLAPEDIAVLYPDLSRSELVEALREAGVAPESEWYEDLLAAHARM